MFQQVVYQFRLTWRLLQDRRVPILNKFIPFAAVLYVLSPIDLIPDVIVGLGQLDDAGVILLSMRLFERSVDPVIVGQHRAVLDGLAPDGMVIDTKDYTVHSAESGKKTKK